MELIPFVRASHCQLDGESSTLCYNNQMPPHDYAPRPAHLKWLLDSDPSIRWQLMRDLTDAVPEAIAVERSRVATEGWRAQLLARQSPSGVSNSKMAVGTAKHPKAAVLRFIPPSACSKGCLPTNGQGANPRPSPKPASVPKTICSSAACSARFAPAKSSTNAGSASPSPGG